jgi:ABC-2 family transporter protein
MISWPVARAATLEKLRSPAVLAVGFCLVAAAFFGGSGPRQAFSGPALVFLVLLTLFLGAGILSDEVESGHAQLVLLRPVTRAAWVGGRLVGAGGALAAIVGAAWVSAAAGALLRGVAEAWVPALAVLPLAVLWAFAWLSVLAAIGAVLPGWTNVAGAALAVVAWGMLQRSLPLVLKRPELVAVFADVGKYLGPQDPLALATWPREGLGPALYDLSWIFGAWLVAVLLFNRRELARRRS